MEGSSFFKRTAAWWGGWWELLIRCIKILRTLGTSILIFEKVKSCHVEALCHVEATVNKRSLIYIFQETDKFVSLTSLLFLHGTEKVGVSDLDTID